jgi:hypothetical protein
MNQEWKEKWVTALRSGEYSQTKGTLRDNDSYCCLGVLCDLVAKENPAFRWIAPFNADIVPFANPDEDPAIMVLPTALVELVGFSSRNPLTSHTDDEFGQCSLANLNDHLDYNFNQIADQIEKDF